ncbi:MAG TPA: hypothetical protein VIT91_19085 [Chthoniobacterales bacterium]
MNFPVYWLKPDVKEDDRLRYGKGMAFRTQLCEQNPDHACRQVRPTPLRLEFRGVAWSDFFWTPYSEAIVNKDVVTAFEEAGIVGCDFVAADLENTLGDEMAGDLYELRPKGWGGFASVESGVRLLEECPHCKNRVFSGYTDPGQLLDLDGWDGSDIFTIWPIPRYILATEAVRNLLVQYQFTGVRAEPITKLPKVIAGTLTPGNVRDWFDEDQAGELDAEIDTAIRARRQRSKS